MKIGLTVRIFNSTARLQIREQNFAVIYAFILAPV